ncbi:MAG: type IV secretion protein DotN [Alphaproteobacteria bacterium CG1_02_46_17]|nr:MAG: type IV secretion protein DotN [Alphaproteobacteria bacterium CG1_02_46_17]
MPDLPLVLGIARPTGAPRSHKLTGSPKVLTPEIKKAVFDRDDNTCQCCGFQSSKYQEVHFLDQDPLNLSMDNMVTACIFCHQCFNLDLACTMRSGVLIWLPEISQTDLHHIMRAVYVARISQGPMAEAARATLDSLMARREEARHRIGTDDPYVLATVMKDFLTSRYYADRGTKLEGLRLMPLDRRLIREADLEFNQFPQILAYWRSKDGPFGKSSPTLWFNLYRDAINGGDKEAS